MEVIMHPIQLSDSEAKDLKEAKRTMEWRGLGGAKLAYLYQRMIALPAGRMDQVLEISEYVSNNREYPDDPKKMFEPWYMTSEKVKGDEFWIDNMTGNKKQVKYLPSSNPIIKKQEEERNELVLGRKSE